MAKPATIQLHFDPPMRDWRVTPRNGRTRPVIATGHQPTLWHAGILAKNIATAVFAQHVKGSALHLSVDYDTLNPLALDLPVVLGPAMTVRRLTLEDSTHHADLPVNARPPIDADRAAQRLREAAVLQGISSEIAQGLHRLADAYDSLQAFPHLAAQTLAVLDRLRRPYVGPIDNRPASTIVTPRFIERLLADPVSCARCYNRAVSAFPQAGITPLHVSRDIVEAPLWAQQPQGQRERVYIDLADSRSPQLFTFAQGFDLTGPDALQVLRPRAISLSALMRSEHCDLFIHGRGGGVYDQVTEHWWHAWTGEALAPMAIVSADVLLDFDVPTATRDQLAQAVWFSHHLPHNVDRYTQTTDDAEAALREEKHNLLAHMDDDRTKRRRSAAFQRLHAINHELTSRHSDPVDAARRAADATRVAVSNADLASRRDWCFTLCSDRAMNELTRLIRQSTPLADLAHHDQP